MLQAQHVRWSHSFNRVPLPSLSPWYRRIGGGRAFIGHYFESPDPESIFGETLEYGKLFDSHLVCHDYVAELNVVEEPISEYGTTKAWSMEIALVSYLSRITFFRAAMQRVLQRPLNEFLAQPI